MAKAYITRHSVESQKVARLSSGQTIAELGAFEGASIDLDFTAAAQNTLPLDQGIYEITIDGAPARVMIGTDVVASNLVGQYWRDGRVATRFVRQGQRISIARADAADSTAPTILTSASQSVAEMAAWSVALAANESVTWSKIGGADAALFDLAGGILSLPARDFEAPSDNGANNSYVVTVRATDGAGNFSDRTITLTVTDVDEIPNAFAFTDQADVASSSVMTSDAIIVAGLAAGVSVAVTVSSGEMQKNGGAWSTALTTAQNGDSFRVRHTSAAGAGAATNTVLTIGGVSDTFTSTTVPAVWRVAATRGEVPSLTGVTSAGNLRRHSRATAVLGAGTYSALRVMDGAFYVDDTNNEVATAGFTLKRWIEIPGAPTPLVAVTFGGQASIDVGSGAVVTSDDILPASFGLASFAAGTVIRHRSEMTFASGVTVAQHLPHWRTSAAVEAASGDGSMTSDATVSVMGTANATGFTANSAMGHGVPLATIGLANNHGKHLAFGGDSISYGASDDYGDGRAGGGPFRRVCYAQNIPYIAMTRNSSLAGDYLIAGRATRRNALMQYALHGLIEWSTNDLNGGASAASALAAVEGIAAVWRTAGMSKVYAWETLIRTNASNVPAAAFAVGGARDTLITSLRGSASLDGTINPNPAVESGVTPRTWASIGATGTEHTQDGTHPKPPGNAAIVSQISADIVTAANGGGL